MIVRNGTAAAARGRLLRRARIAAVTVSGMLAVASASLLATTPSAVAAPAAAKLPASQYVTINGAGSTWAENAIATWVSDVGQNGLEVNYSAVGSTSGRQDFADGADEWGASEIPYGVQDGTNYDPPPSRGFVYMPDVAGGTTFMYNLKIDGAQVTNLRLSPKSIADIFTGKIGYWDNPEIKKDNPDLDLPHLQITAVVRSDGSGETADFTQWMLATEPSDWDSYCQEIGFSPCTQTSAYQTWSGAQDLMVAQAGDTGVSGYVSQTQEDGAIGYTQFSFAIQAGFPVALLENADGYYTEPTPGNVAISLEKAQINEDASNPKVYLTENLSNVYTDPDPRTYELSAYSYLILPTDTSDNFTDAAGNSLGAFGNYLLCQGQQQVDSLGYSALPINLVEAGYTQLGHIPGAQVPSTSSSFIQSCNNPTFSSNGTNELADQDPIPAACNKAGTVQCGTPTGGASGSGGATGKTGSTSSGGSGGGGTNGTGTGGGTNSTGTGGGTNSTGTGGGTNGTGTGGGTNGTGTGGGTNSTGTGGAGATTPGDGAATCDPNTGICSTPGTNGTTGNGGSVADAGNPVPITLSANDDGVQAMLMALGAVLLLALCIVPPLAAQASDRRRQRRRAGWSAMPGDDERPGGRL